MMTVKRQIVKMLNKAQYPMTNKEIAKKIKRPEASVRRATKELNCAGRIRVNWLATGGNLNAPFAYQTQSQG